MDEAFLKTILFEPTSCRPHDYIRTVLQDGTVYYLCEGCTQVVTFLSEKREKGFLKLADKKTMDASKAS